MKIRNPQLVEEEIVKIAKMEDYELSILIVPIVVQFWNWVKLRSDVSLSDIIISGQQTEEFVKKGYPKADVVEFMLKKLQGIDKKEAL